MRRWSLLLVAMCAGACASPPPKMQAELREPVLEGSPTDAAPLPTDAATPDAAPPDDGIKRPERPETTGCSFVADHADVNLGASTERSFVSHPSARARVWLGKTSAWIEMETRDVRVAGVTHFDGFSLYPKKPMPFGDCCAVARHTALYPEVVDATHVDVTIPFGDQQKRTVRFACDDIVFGRPPRESPDVPGWPTAKRAVVLAKPTPISDTIDGPPVSAFELRRKIRVLETKNGRARIGWERDHAILTGWIPASAVAPENTPLEVNHGRIVVLEDLGHGVNGGEEESPPPPAPWPRMVCEHDVPLVAVWVEHYAWRLGVVKAGTPLAFGKYPRIGHHKVLERGSLDVTVEQNTELHVPTSALAGCKNRGVDGKVVPMLGAP